MNFAKYAIVLAVGAGLAFGMMSHTVKNVGAQATEKADERFYMLNALWFKEDGGAEKYQEYMDAAGPFVEKHGGNNGSGAYVPEQAMIGTFDADLLFFVEWPNQEAFLGLINDPGYKAISHLRGEAITDSLLIRCRKL
jgi:uncharacterized protein (DUF1330 family)